MHNNLSIFNFSKKIFKLIFIGLILLIVINSICNVLKFKYGDGIYSMENFYTLDENIVDVLVLGSSKVFEDVNPAILYEEDGMTAYVLGGGCQAMWNTYFYLKEGLKTQTPELIVLECFCTTYDSDYMDNQNIIKNTYGLKWSTNKWNSIQASITPDEFFDFFPEFIQYHNRYEALYREDFLPYKGKAIGYADWKGHGDNFESVSFDKPIIRKVTKGAKMNKKVEEYYRKIIELAKQENIPILIIVSPYSGITNEEQKILFTAGEIAEEYNVKFIDFNYLYDEIGIDFTKDCADGLHLNYIGNEKFSRYLSKYIKNNFVVSDRRNDSTYRSWKRNTEWRKQTVLDHEISIINNYDEYKSFLENRTKNENFYIISTTTDNVEKNSVCQVYCGTKKIYERDETGGSYIFNLSKWDVLLLDGNQSIIINNKDYKQVDTGKNIVIYDRLTETIVDSVGIEANSKVLVRKLENNE